MTPLDAVRLAESGDRAALPTLLDLLAEDSKRHVAATTLDRAGFELDRHALGAIRDAYVSEGERRKKLESSFRDRDALDRAHPDPRPALARCIGRLRDPSAIPELLELARSGETSVLASAGLAALGPAAAPATIAALGSGVKDALERALIGMRSDEAFDAVLDARGPGDTVWLLSGSLMQDAQSPEKLLTNWCRAHGWPWLERLVPALDDERSHVQNRMLQTIGMLGHAEGIPYLVQGLTSDVHAVHGGAANGLRRLAEPSTAPAMVDALDRDQTSALELALRAVPEAARQACVAARHDKRPRVRLGILKVLRHLEGDGVEKTIREATLDIDDNVRREAVTATVKAGWVDEVLVLLEALSSDEWERAASALSQFGTPAAYLGLRTALDLGDTRLEPFVAKARYAPRPPRWSDKLGPEGVGSEAREARPARPPRLANDKVSRTPSHFGGRPLLADDELWPCCGSCGGPLTLLVQLDRSSLPVDAVEPGEGLLQVWRGRCAHAPLLARTLTSGSHRLPSDPHMLPEYEVAGWGPAADDHPVPNAFRGDKLGGFSTAGAESPADVLLLQLARSGALHGSVGDGVWVFTSSEGVSATE